MRLRSRGVRCVSDPCLIRASMTDIDQHCRPALPARLRDHVLDLPSTSLPRVGRNLAVGPRRCRRPVRYQEATSSSPTSDSEQTPCSSSSAVHDSSNQRIDVDDHNSNESQDGTHLGAGLSSSSPPRHDNNTPPATAEQPPTQRKSARLRKTPIAVRAAALRAGAIARQRRRVTSRKKPGIQPQVTAHLRVAPRLAKPLAGVSGRRVVCQQSCCGCWLLLAVPTVFLHCSISDCVL